MANMAPPPAPRAPRAANRPRRRRSQRSLDATKWNRGSTSGILCVRSCPSRQDSEPRNPRATRSAAGRRRLQRKRRDTRHPTQQRSRLCQSLPQGGADFSAMTNRLRSLSESRPRPWAYSGGPRFHFVASRLHLLRFAVMAARMMASPKNAIRLPQTRSRPGNDCEKRRRCVET